MAGTGLTPVHFFSHGTTKMLEEESSSATYWKKAGDEALAHGIKGVIMMGAHWDCFGDNCVEIATKRNPGKIPVGYTDTKNAMAYKIDVDVTTANRCMAMLEGHGINARGNDKFDWIHDSYLILVRMFPDKCPPTTLLSLNSRYDPHFHLRIGSILRPLRKENYLFIGTGGAVHNLYRNQWGPLVRYADSFAMETPPESWALEFRQAMEDAFTNNSGPRLRRAVTRLMKHPEYRDAHGTDEHFLPACFVAGAVGDPEDTDVKGVLHAEDWELTNMCDSQYTFGSWQAVAT